MKKQAIVSLLFFAGVLLVNYLANALPINGLNTGEVSALYPNLFVPDGLTFSIWGIIYLLLLAFVVYQLVVAFTGSGQAASRDAITAINPWFWVTCMLNMGWILVWHHLWVAVSLLVMVLFLITLIYIFNRLQPFRQRLKGIAAFCIVVPFVVYLPWICVATVANTTAVLVHKQWQPLGLPESTWSIIMLVIVGLLTAAMILRFRVAAFALVIAWAAWGIYRGQFTADPAIGYAAAAIVLVSLLLAVYAFMKPLQVQKLPA